MNDEKFLKHARAFQKHVYGVSADHGFHERDSLEDVLPRDGWVGDTAAYDAVSKHYDELQDSNRILLAVGELLEAHDEIRAGKSPTETHYSLKIPTGPIDVTIPAGYVRPSANGSKVVFPNDLPGTLTMSTPLINSTDTPYQPSWEFRRKPQSFHDTFANAGVFVPFTHAEVIELGWIHQKPEGVPSELADAVIRIFDLAEARGIDLPAMLIEKSKYNESREYRHGRKF